MTQPDQMVIVEPIREDQTDNPPAPVEEAEDYTIHEEFDLLLLSTQLAEAMSSREPIDVSVAGPADPSQGISSDNPATLYVEVEVPRRIVDKVLASYKTPDPAKPISLDEVKEKASRSEPLTADEIQVALRGLLA